MISKELNKLKYNLFINKSTKLLGMLIFFLVLFIFFFSPNQTSVAHFVEPDKDDTCPICGMSISEHPRWVAVIMFSDGKHVKLHGPKSMFTYYFNLGGYNKKYSKKNVATLHVTDYFTLEHLRAEKAYYVINSNIQGPMGAELISFKDISSAESFTKKHGGRILRFKEITPEIVNSLKNILPDNYPAGK